MHPLPTNSTRRELIAGAARMLLVSAGLIVLYAVLPFQSDNWAIGAVVGVVAIAAIVPLTVRRVEAIKHARQPGLVAIEALMMIVAMLVLGFSGLYLIIDRNGDQFADLDTRIDAVYFTVTTLSTVGFGDIHPYGQLARFFVVLQILIDFSLLALSVRMLTSTFRRRIEAQ